jgi:phosphate uptake regulator
MKRKLIELGGSVYVSLPSTYVKSNELKKGQEINVDNIDNNIVISTSPIVKETTRTITINNNFMIGKRYVTALYRRGIDSINLNYEGEQTLKAVKKLMDKDTIGYEIIKQTKNSITIKDFSVKSTNEFSNIIRRMWLILLENSKELIKTVESKEFQSLNMIIARDKDINKFSNYCCRLVFKGSLNSFEKSVIMYNFLRNLENISDSFKEISKYLLEEKINLEEKSVKNLRKTFSILESYYKLFYEFNLHTLNELVIKIRQIEKGIKLEMKTSKEVRENLYITGLLKKLDQLASNFVELN